MIKRIRAGVNLRFLSDFQSTFSWKMKGPLNILKIYMPYMTLIIDAFGNKRLSLRISIVGTVISLFLLASNLQPLGLIQGEAIAQQLSQQEPRQKISVGDAASNNFTTYTNPTYGFSLLYPTEWINEEINPGVNLTFLISFNPPPTEFGESIFVYMAASLN